MSRPLKVASIQRKLKSKFCVGFALAVCQFSFVSIYTIFNLEVYFAVISTQCTDLVLAAVLSRSVFVVLCVCGFVFVIACNCCAVNDSALIVAASSFVRLGSFLSMQPA